MVTKTRTDTDPLRRLSKIAPDSPALVIDLAIVEEEFLKYQAAFPDSRIYYAVKANSEPAVLRRLFMLGAGFEIASTGEMTGLRNLGVPAERMISSNPIKPGHFIKAATQEGVSYFTFDSEAEADKFAEIAPKAGLYVRIAVPNVGSEWPLEKKFGVEIEEGLHLLKYAKRKGLNPVGLTFHVGSQNRNAQGWGIAMEKAQSLWQSAKRAGIDMRVLNIGGGMPVVYTNPDVPTPSVLGDTILAAKERYFPGVSEMWLEPGRAMVARAGTMLATVQGVARRAGKRWVYLDAGIFHGLAEGLGGITYQVITDARGAEEPTTLAGPSCDSMDVVAKGVMLPQLKVGDRIAFAACGAYTTVYSSNFNGMPGPKTVVIDSAVNAR